MKQLPQPKNLTDLYNSYHKQQFKEIVEASFLLNKNDVLETLKHEVIYFQGNYYKVPETQLMNHLINKDFGSIRLRLEKIKDK